MTVEPTWRFRTIAEDEKEVEPTHREHLAPGGVVEPLVREAIQNSLDATLEGQPTKVAITLGEANPAIARRYFDQLRPHLNVEEIARYLPEGVPDPADKVRFVAIEDYNTTGLEGDPAGRSQESHDRSMNHFFRFWHRVGPPIESKRRGNWGVGKVVFSNASRIRTFFGLTLRRGDTGPLLMGEAGLVIHSLPGSTTKNQWYGYFANHQPRGNHHVVLPIQGSAADDFAETFSLSRCAPGLSIVVPYVREEVNLHELAQAVIEHYFLPILAGRLEVRVRDRTDSFQISKSTIDDVVNQLKWPSKGPSSKPEVAALLRLARWQIDLKSDQYVLLNAADSGDVKCLRDRFPYDAIARLADDFVRNKLIAIRIPVRVRPKQGDAVEEEVRVVLERDESLRKGNVPHLRSGINISKMRSHGPGGVRGLLIVGVDSDKRGELDKLLQASEGPAHMNWENRGEGYDKAKSDYHDAHKVIHFMRELVKSLVELLATPQDERDTRTLSSFFPDYSEIENDGGPKQGHRRRRGDEQGTPPPLPASVIEGVVQSFAGMHPVEGAEVQLHTVGAAEMTALAAITKVDGEFRWEGLLPGKYDIAARKEGIGEAHRTIDLPVGKGLHVELVLRPQPPPKMFAKVPLDDGFGIRGNPKFQGAFRPIRVRLAYAAWGGSKSYDPADFSLENLGMSISFSGVREGVRAELITAPNVLRFTPVRSDFYVEVRGFDVNRALYVDARSTDEAQSDGGEE